jgi:hypothetical protein
VRKNSHPPTAFKTGIEEKASHAVFWAAQATVWHVANRQHTAVPVSQVRNKAKSVVSSLFVPWDQHICNGFSCAASIFAWRSCQHQCGCSPADVPPQNGAAGGAAGAGGLGDGEFSIWDGEAVSVPVQHRGAASTRVTTILQHHSAAVVIVPGLAVALSARLQLQHSASGMKTLERHVDIMPR